MWDQGSQAWDQDHGLWEWDRRPRNMDQQEKPIFQFGNRKYFWDRGSKYQSFGIKEQHFRLKFGITICSCVLCHDPEVSHEATYTDELDIY